MKKSTNLVKVQAILIMCLKAILTMLKPVRATLKCLRSMPLISAKMKGYAAEDTIRRVEMNQILTLMIINEQKARWSEE